MRKNKNLKKLNIALAALVSAATVAGACAPVVAKTTSEEKDSDTLRIVTTIFPEYDWVREVLGDQAEHADVTMLLDNGVDLHSYQPTADDIIKISECDLFIYVGGESDAWIEDALKESKNKNQKVINLLDVLKDTVKIEEIVPGMQDEEDHTDGAEKAENGQDDNSTDRTDEINETDEESTEDMSEDEEEEYDEHVWLSLKNAEVICQSIADELGELDPENKDAYEANVEAYIDELTHLGGQYQDVVDAAARKTILFGDRFPFRYMVDDYGLRYYAAFAGCSAESEASFETISFLAKKVDELKLPCILTIEGEQHKIAETIKANTKDQNQEILTMDSMQSVTAEDVQNGVTYLSIMEENLNVLKQALK